MSASRRVAPLAALVLTSALGGCACTDWDHLAFTNLTDRALVPDPGLGRHALTPLLIPLGAVTIALDNVVVAPVANLPSAVLDADAFWRAEAGGYFTELALLPGRVVLTPLVALGSWIVRSFFGIAPREEARWGWPAWGAAWVRGGDGRLLGPSAAFDPVTKRRRPAPAPAHPPARSVPRAVEVAPPERPVEARPAPPVPDDEPLESIPEDPLAPPRAGGGR